MDKNDKSADFLTASVIAGGLATCVASVILFPPQKLDFQLLALTLVTIFFSSNFQFRLPKYKIHFSVADVFIFLSFFIYGGGVAVILSAVESLNASIHFRRTGTSVKSKTFALNFSISTLATFATALVLDFFFHPLEIAISESTATGFIIILCLTVIVQFIVNSILVSYFAAKRSGRTFWQVWNEFCFSFFALYIAEAMIAGLMFKFIQQFNFFLFLLVITIAAIVYMTYRRYVDEIRKNSALAEQAEKERAEAEKLRAEQAEKHIEELNHYIAEQERISLALRESKEKFRHAAFHDALTDLPNRGLFVETLKFLIERARQSRDFHFSVLFLDLNRFKTINDSLGHNIGDQLLGYVAMRLRNTLRDGDTLARFGGDEFGIILNGIDNVEDAVGFARRIQEKVTAPFSLGGHQVFTSVSIGIAMSSANYECPDHILRDADIAMYSAKEKGQDYMVFDDSMHAKAVNRLQLETDLRYAVERNEFVVFYQPIVELETGNVAGFEALMRWKHPEKGMVSPAEFIPLSEDTGLIIPMTLWLLRDACKQLATWRWKSPANRSLMISINLSGKHFAQKDLVDQVRLILEETGLDPHCLKLEITESAIMENAEETTKMLMQLKELGLQLSIDDFGTGYSSLSHLHRFPIDTLKIDRSFVMTMGDSGENGEIVRTIISLANNLGMNVVAEGIETIDQLHQLKTLKCQYGQGFLFSRPVPKEEAEAIIENKKHWAVSVQQTEPQTISNVKDFPHLRLAK